MKRFKDFLRTMRKHFHTIQAQIVKEEPQATLVQNIPDKGFILDAGSGEGQFARMLNNPGRTILCLDIKPPKKRNFENDYILGSVECLPFKKEVFDFVYCLSVLQFVKNDEQSLDEFHRTLKTGKKLLFTVPTKYSIFHLIRELELFFNVYEYPEFNVPHHHYYSKTRIKHVSAKYFSGVKIRGYNFNFFPRFLSLILNLFKKYHSIRSNSGNFEENPSIEQNSVHYPKQLPDKHFFWVFDVFSQFFNFLAYHYCVVAEKE
jgi:SAM-dependent methyltransferase